MSDKKTVGLAAIVGAGVTALLLTFVATEESGGRKYHNAYLDVAGVATICDGLTRYENGVRVRLGDHRTEAQCSALLDQALAKTAGRVLACTPQLKGRDFQTAAAVSLAYNIGEGAYCGSTAARRFRAGQWSSGCDAFMAWNKARVRGVLRPVQGLTARRGRERALCLRGL
jgi:lysozyme